jgi:DNA-binding IclR family transcriptional regulator
MSKIAQVLEVLEDGRWHALSEIQEKTGLSESQIQQTVAFLKEYGFIVVNEAGREIKLEEIVREFLA